MQRNNSRASIYRSSLTKQNLLKPIPTSRARYVVSVLHIHISLLGVSEFLRVPFFQGTWSMYYCHIWNKNMSISFSSQFGIQFRCTKYDLLLQYLASFCVFWVIWQQIRLWGIAVVQYYVLVLSPLWMSYH